MPNEKFQPSSTANKILSPKLQWNKYKIRLRFEWRCLKQEDTNTYYSKQDVNLFIVYELCTWSQDIHTDFTLKDCLFGSDTDTDK